MSSISAAALLLAAGVLAGLVGTAGGITSLISYPALLAAGVPVLPATVANNVALIGGWPGAALASQPELAGRGRWLARWTWPAAGGAAAGAVLLLSTPPGAFDRVVPFLVLAGSLSLVLQPRLAARRGGRRPGRGALLPGGLVAVSIYNGYFGAGAGVMTLALLLSAAEGHLPTANALKNMLIGAGSIAAAVVFAAFGPVDWTAVAPLGAGMFVGSMIGPRVARRLPTAVLRWLIALIGLGLAVQLWVAAG